MSSGAKLFNDWSEEISIEEADPKLREIATEIKKRNLEVPAILLFESHKPLSYLGGQAMMFFAPFLVPILGYQKVHDYARLLNRRDSIERLLQYLEGPMEALISPETPEVSS